MEQPNSNQSAAERYRRERIVSEETAGGFTFKVHDSSFVAGAPPYTLSTTDTDGIYYEIRFKANGEMVTAKAWAPEQSHPKSGYALVSSEKGRAQIRQEVRSEIIVAAKQAFKQFSN